MSYVLLGLAFAVIGFLVANTVLSLAVLALFPSLRSSLRRAGPLFLLRMLPAAGSIVAAFGLALPAFLAFEPRVTSETIGPAFVPVIVLALLLVAAGLGRVLATWAATRAIVRVWEAGAAPLSGLGIPVPVYRVATGLPVAALVGIIRPRLFVSDRLVDVLSTDELRAVLGHETAHLVARDNLRRTLLRLAPDWLGLCSAGRRIEAAWAVAAEEQADDRAAAGCGGVLHLDLASSLLKAARMVPAGTGRLLPASNFCDGANVARRVSRLLDPPQTPVGSARGPVLALAGIGAVLLTAAAAAEPALRTVYLLVEAAVQRLQ